MKTVKLSLTEDYVSHWSWWEGARELMQNAIDTGDYDIVFGHTSLTITSRGGNLPINSLLLGKSTKKDDPSMIGKFGEGMKLGFLVLLREGAKIAVENGKDLWFPRLMEDDDFGCTILAVDIQEGADEEKPENTVVVKIQNIPEWAVEEIEDKYAPTTDRDIFMENNRGKAYKKITPYDEDEEPETSCSLFVNGLFVSKVEGNFKFDYDFKPDVFQLDRDRGTVSAFDVKYHATKLLSESDDIEMLARLSMLQYDDLSMFSGRREKNSGGYYFSGNRGESDQEALCTVAAKMFKEKHGDDAFPISEDWTDGRKKLVTQMAISRGMTPITVNKSLYTMVEKKYGVSEKIENILVFKPLEWLEKFLEKYGRRLDSKPRKELEKTIHLLKVAQGKE